MAIETAMHCVQSMLSTGYPLSMRVLKQSTPEAHRHHVEGIVKRAIEDGHVRQVGKDKYQIV